MSKILFTHSYFYKYDPKQWNTKQPYPPLGTLYASSFLKREGHSVQLFDTNLANTPDEIIPQLAKFNPKYLVIYDDGFNYLTKMCLTKMREAAFRLISIGKEYNCTVIVASSDSSDHYEKYLNKGADFILIGEGEATLKELIEKLDEESKEYDTVKGLAYLENNKVIRTGGRQIMNDLDDLPLPAWDLIDIKAYRKIWIDNQGYFSLNVATTRGCPFKCNWCAKPIYGNRYNTRSPRNVVDEIEFLLEIYQPNHIWFCDDIFGLKPGWIKEFSELVAERNLKFRYKIQSRVDLLLNENNIDELAKSGAETIWVGAESGSQKILDAMDKGTKVEQIYKTTKLLKQKHVKVAFFIQLGYIGETKEDIDRTIRMIKELIPDDIGISVSYPLPGTKFYEKVKDDLKAKSNWSDSDDLAMMFRNTFKPAYYKKLHHLIHRIYRRSKAANAIKTVFKNPFRINSSLLKAGLTYFYYSIQIFMDSISLRRIESHD